MLCILLILQITIHCIYFKKDFIAMLYSFLGIKLNRGPVYHENFQLCPAGYWNIKYFIFNISCWALRNFARLSKLLFHRVQLATAGKMLRFISEFDWFVFITNAYNNWWFSFIEFYSVSMLINFLFPFIYVYLYFNKKKYITGASYIESLKYLS